MHLEHKPYSKIIILLVFSLSSLYQNIEIEDLSKNKNVLLSIVKLQKYVEAQKKVDRITQQVFTS